MESKTFSIYLLKPQYTPDNSLKDGCPLGSPVPVANLPTGSRLYLMDSKPYAPWWKDYWGIEEDIQQSLAGAIVFIPVNARFFALTFGHTYQYLKEFSYEYGFGLKMTLNSLNPNKLKSTDILNPEDSRRQRIQSPIGSDITFFNFDRDSSIIKRLTGKVKDEYKNLISNTTGANNLTVGIKKRPEDIPRFLSEILTIYNKNNYKETFPDLHNIVPLQDPLIIEELNTKLLEAFSRKEDELVLAVPDMVDYTTDLYIYFSGSGRKQVKIYPDVYIDYYREYLSSNFQGNVTVQDLKKHSMNLCNEDGKSTKSYSVFKSLLFNCEMDNNYYHLTEGQWYQIEKSYLKNLEKNLDTYFYDDKLLIKYNHKSENDYNTKISDIDKRFICLDKENIAPKNQSQVEPCDIYIVLDETAKFYHVKFLTRSASLSHLFNQGLVSVELIRTEQESKDKLKEIIEQKTTMEQKQGYIAPIINEKIQVVYAIITRKDSNKKSHNLPLFSKIALKKCINAFKLMRIDVKVCFIKDVSDKRSGNLRKRIKNTTRNKKGNINAT
jgi:uncharacterized protein (TIGR04141 family)